jgi:quercetin dioxygenase-like cupin family protein
LIFALYERREGIETEPGALVVYDIAGNVAHASGARVEGPALVWALDDDPHEGFPALVADVELNPDTDWVARCDRVDFPPGGVAYRHVHPGPGIRRLLFGELTIESEEETRTYGAGEAWFEGPDYPVLATASATERTAFVRVLILPAEWAGKRTIRYLDPTDEDKPKLQRAEVLLEEPLGL